MIPLLAAIPAVASVAGSLFHAMAPKTQGPAPVDAEFVKHLIAQTREQDRLNALPQPGAVQSMIAMQQSMGPLPLDQQLDLARQVLNKTVQVRDSSGNSAVGMVSGINLQNGQVQLLIGGKSYSISSLQAVLPGLEQASPPSTANPAAQPLLRPGNF